MSQEALERVSISGALIKRVSANSAAFSDDAQSKGYGTSNANLRGLVANSSLVLLHGRRLSKNRFVSVDSAVSVESEPPYTAAPSYGAHAAGYAQSFPDPRGRFWCGSLSHQFK